MATGFPFNDRRQRPEVMGAGARVHRATGETPSETPDANAASSHHTIHPARAFACGRSYVDIASVTGGPSLPHRDVLG